MNGTALEYDDESHNDEPYRANDCSTLYNEFVAPAGNLCANKNLIIKPKDAQFCGGNDTPKQKL